MMNHDDDLSTLLTLSQPSSVTALTRKKITQETMNHDDDAFMDDSSRSTLSQPSSSPPRPLPFEFEYIPLTHPFNPQLFFHSDILYPALPAAASALSYEEQDMVISPSWLTLSHPSYSSSPPPPPPQPLTPSLSPPNAIPTDSEVLESPQSIQPPFPWATLKPATVHTINHLLHHLNLNTISGTLECKTCKFQQTDYRFDLLEKFEMVANFIKENKFQMHNRAPHVWMKPVLPNCRSCGEKSPMQPFIGKDEEINWLFLFLGEMIGCCNLEQLRYFCKQNDIHRSGAKDRLLYQTYLSLCKQLQPHGPFDP